MTRGIILAITLAVAAMAQQATDPPSGKGENAKVAVEARGYFDRESAKAALGIDPGPNVVIVEVRFTPKDREKMRLDLDEFLLRADNDGQTARPMAPSQIAGTSVMVVGSRGGTQGAPMGGNRRVPYGVPGIPGGPVPGGAPPTLPDPSSSGVGSATADTSEATASIEEGKGSKEQRALLNTLKEKVLPEGEIEGPVSGLLYFNFEGKHKVKHFELVYGKWPPRASVRFVEPKKK